MLNAKTKKWKTIIKAKANMASAFNKNLNGSNKMLNILLMYFILSMV